MAKIKLMLVDDHEIVRSGLRMMLSAEPDFEIIYEAESGEEALERVEACDPDVIIMDISLPNMDGVITTRQIKDKCPHIPILALTIHEDERYFFQMLDAGASGYVPKRAAPNDLVEAIRRVLDGQVYVYPTLTTALVSDYLHRTKDDSDKRELYSELTERQREVLILLAEGLSNAEIAKRLDISAKTVIRHKDNIMSRLDLHSRIELVKYAIRKGLIEA